jgi:hypothetical protein
MKNMFLLLFIFTLWASCKQSPAKESAITSAPDSSTLISQRVPVTGTDSLAQSNTATQSQKTESEYTPTPPSDSVIATLKNNPPVNKGLPKTNPHHTDHICSPNFNVIAKPQQNTHFYYVTAFDPREFKCWQELEVHGSKICAEQECIIYYLDSPNVTVASTGNTPIDATTLTQKGIGRFVHNGKFWEIKGASMWKRKENGYAYYNTNNHLGG